MVHQTEASPSQAMDNDGLTSFMYPIGYQSHTCGYCKSKRPLENTRNYYAGSASRAVHPAHYQEILQRGWRRSGTTWYKADVKHSCCPHYSTRVDATKYKPHKDQRRAVNQFTRYVLGPEYVRKAAQLCPKSREEVRWRKQVFDTKEVIHEPEYAYVPRPFDSRKRTSTLEPAHKFEVTLEPDTFTDEKYQLFANYQRMTHKEPPHRITPHGFRSFLCSGLQQSTMQIDGRDRRVGSYHQCYRLDGRLVAIGVLDLLPYGVSSVYLIYHDDVSHWELGKLSAMREIALAVEEGYQYYYMGYYIHTCVKMRYKRSFYPTYVLDPENYNWDLFDAGMARRLTARKYVSLSRERALGIPEPPADEVGEQPLVNQRTFDGDYESPGMAGSVFEANMPGVLTLAEVQQQVSLGDVHVRISGRAHTLGHLSWSMAQDPTGPLYDIAEFIACVGPETAKKITMDLG